MIVRVNWFLGDWFVYDRELVMAGVLVVGSNDRACLGRTPKGLNRSQD